MPSSNRLNWLLTRERRAETPLARRILAFEPVPIEETNNLRSGAPVSALRSQETSLTASETMPSSKLTSDRTRRARPKGVLSAEVWVKLVEADEPAPTDPAALFFLTMTTRPTFRADFKPGEGGKTAVYMARWINTRGEKGPWSEIATATVAA